MLMSEKIVNLLRELSQYGIDVSTYEYGLPLHEPHLEPMTDIVKEWLKSLFDEDTPTSHQEPTT